MTNFEIQQSVPYFMIIGLKWRQVRGKLRQVASGPGGVTYGVTKRESIFYRAGVTRSRPVGRNWVRIGGKLFHVTLGCTGIYGTTRNGQIWKYRGE